MKEKEKLGKLQYSIDYDFQENKVTAPGPEGEGGMSSDQGVGLAQEVEPGTACNQEGCKFEPPAPPS